jgi:hypothetical protein
MTTPAPSRGGQLECGGPLRKLAINGSQFRLSGIQYLRPLARRRVSRGDRPDQLGLPISTRRICTWTPTSRSRIASPARFCSTL